MSTIMFLRIHKGNELLGIKQFQDAQILIGSGSNAQLHFNDEDVAEVHAMIERRESEFFITDLGSGRETYLNGHAVVDQRIQPGDVIRIGAFRVELALGVPKFTTPRADLEPQKSPKGMSVPKGGIPDEIPTVVRELKPKEKSSAKSKAIPSVSAGGLDVAPTPKRPYPAAAKGTFAPPDQTADPKKTLKPAAGNAVEVTVSWGSRILEARVFSRPGVVTVGSHPSCDISLPVLGATRVRQPVLNLGAQTYVYFSDVMDAEILEAGKWRPLREVTGRVVPAGAIKSIELKSTDVVRLGIGGGVSLYFRYVNRIAVPVPGPVLDLSPQELAAVLLVLAVGAILALYMAIYVPPIDETPLEELPRKAVFVYKRFEPPPEIIEEPKEVKPPEPVATPPPKKVKIDIKKDAAAEQSGTASDAPKFKSKTDKKIPTTALPGKDKGLRRGGNGKPAVEDKSGGSTGKVDAPAGLLSVFARKGTQEQLKAATEGSGAVGNLGAKASGSGGQARGSGWETGEGLKELGASGQGTGSVGVGGVTTRGRGGGLSGYGTGVLGSKKGAEVRIGGDGNFSDPSLDRAGIRRVIEKNQNELRSCYERGLNKDPSIHGKISVTWDIDDRGDVVGKSSYTTTMNDKNVETCIVNAIRRWKFPPSPQGVVGEVTYPFVFAPQD